MAADIDCSGWTGPKPLQGRLDATIVGAGIAGLYQLHFLRNQGLSAKAFDSASDVGVTCYSKRYVGARLDTDACIYQYLLAEDRYQG